MKLDCLQQICNEYRGKKARHETESSSSCERGSGALFAGWRVEGNRCSCAKPTNVVAHRDAQNARPATCRAAHLLGNKKEGFASREPMFFSPSLEAKHPYLLRASVSSPVSQPRPESQKAPSLVMTAVTKSRGTQSPAFPSASPHVQQGSASIPHPFPSLPKRLHTHC